MECTLLVKELMMIRISLITIFVTAVFATSTTAQDTAALTVPSLSRLRVLPNGSADVRTASTFAQPSPPERDSRLNGFLIGFIAGAVPGILFGIGVDTYCRNESSSNCVWAIPIMGGLFGLAGGGIGYAIDDAIHQSPTFGRPRPSPGLRFSIRF
jgi:hypothetical protein